MHQIPTYESSISLFWESGKVEVFKSRKAALKALGLRWIERNVGPHFRVFNYENRVFDTERELEVVTPQYLVYACVMRDDAGQVVTAASFHDLIERRRWFSRWSWQWRLRYWNGEGPVPGVHRQRGGHWFRRPKTTGERRAAGLVLEEEGEVAPRCKRNHRNLPNAWDDDYIWSRANHNWKKFRRTRWKTPRD